MRARNILIAIAVLAAAVVVVWRPWRDAAPAPADLAAGDVEPAAVPPSPPPPQVAGDPAGTPSVQPPPPPAETPPRVLERARMPDTKVVPVVPTSENRSRLQALRQGLVGQVPAAARLYGAFARAGRPAPPEAKKLLEMRRAGASHDELAAYVRSSFPEPADRAIATQWLDSGGAVVAPAHGDGG